MKLFLTYLLPDFILLFLAVLTAFGSAYLNIRVPSALGVLINSMNEMSKANCMCFGGLAMLYELFSHIAASLAVLCPPAASV